MPSTSNDDVVNEDELTEFDTLQEALDWDEVPTADELDDTDTLS